MWYLVYICAVIPRGLNHYNGKKKIYINIANVQQVSKTYLVVLKVFQNKKQEKQPIYTLKNWSKLMFLLNIWLKLLEFKIKVIKYQSQKSSDIPVGISVEMFETHSSGMQWSFLEHVKTG